MVHISIWPKFQTWHWTKWTSLVDRLHWSIPIKVKGYLQNDQISTVPLKKYCFFCFCLFSLQNHFLLFFSPYWGWRGSPLLWADPLQRQENRSPTKHYITLHYITSLRILFLRNCLQSKFCPPAESWLPLPLSPLLQAKGASLGKKIR